MFKRKSYAPIKPYPTTVQSVRIITGLLALNEKSLDKLVAFLNFNEIVNMLMIKKVITQHIKSNLIFKYYNLIKKEFKMKTKENEMKVNFDKYSLDALLKKDAELISKIIKKNSIPKKEGIMIFTAIINRQIKKTINDNRLSLTNYNLKNNLALVLYCIKEITSLNYFEFSYNALTSNSIKNLIIGTKTNLRILNLSHNNMDDNAGITLFTLLPENCPHIVILNVSYNNFSVKTFSSKSTKQFLSSETMIIEKLNLSHNLIGSKGAIELFDALQNNKSIHVLNLSFNGIDTNVFNQSSVEMFFSNNRALYSFYYEGNYLPSFEVEMLIKCLVPNESVNYLYLGNNQINDESLDYIGYLISHNANIHNLDLSYNHIGNKGIKTLCEKIAWRTRLIDLNLSNNNISNDSLKTIVNTLNSNQTIMSLNLSYNKFNSKQSGDLLCELLSNNHQLKTLNLNSCHLGLSCKKIFEILGQNERLGLLDLSGNDIGNNTSTFELFKECMSSNKMLRYLYLDGNYINDKDFELICEGIKLNILLKVLSLKMNKITLKNSIDIISCISLNDNIKEICLEGNPIANKNELEMIHKALQANGTRRKKNN